MSTSVSSLGSSQISSQLATVEARLELPITQLKTQATADTATISAWGTVQGVLSTLSSSLSGIKDVSTINVRAATSSTSSVASVTAASSASVGTYNLTGVTLAKAQEIYSGVQTSATASLGTGSGTASLTFTLKSGKTETLSLGSSSTSLNGIAAAINKLGGGIQASVVGTSGGARLTLQGSATGSSQAFSVTGTGALAKFDYTIDAPGTMTSAQTAVNAAFNINGVPVSDATNTITNAVPGVTISLAGSGTTSLSVSSSPGSIAAAVATVATNLNAAIAAIAKQTAYTPASSANATTATSAAAGALLGSFTASNIQNQLLTSVSGAAASGLSSNAIGLTVGIGGAVSFDSAKFSTAYAANPTGVTKLITQIYGDISNVTTGALGSAGTTSGAGSSAVTVAPTSSNKGSIAAETTGLQNNVVSIAAQEATIVSNNNAQLQILIQQYSVAEAAATAAATTQAYLSLFTSSSSSTKG
jgi:flagellar hook-associated protein 2